jgi:hypothetical protein
MLSFNFPINSVSFGQVATALLREAYKANERHSLFPIGPIDLSTQRPDKDFNAWLQDAINSSPANHDRRQDGALKLWHIAQSLETYSARESSLLTFHETDSLTPVELNILSQQDRVFVTSSYTKRVFESHGLSNVTHLPLGFDSHNFKPTVRLAYAKNTGIVNWLLTGKMEGRKSTLRQLSLWAKKYGNRKTHTLNVAITNGFIKPEDQNAMIGNALAGKSYWNINFLPFSPTNEQYNLVLQSSDIHLACSLCEGFDLPVYHSTALGTLPVALNAHVFPDYLNNSNAVLVQPSETMVPAVDGVFFKAGAPINQGNWHTFSDEAFYAGCEEAERRVLTNGLNTNGSLLMRRTYTEVYKELIGSFEPRAPNAPVSDLAV